MSFATAVTLNGGSSGLVSINTAVSGTGGDITFQSTLDATTATDSETLTLNAGTAGNILFTGAVGGTRRLGDRDDHQREQRDGDGGASRPESLTQSAGGGTTLLNGAVNTEQGDGGCAHDQRADHGGQHDHDDQRGTVTFTNAGLLTLNGDIAADGAVTQNGAGAVTITAPRSITTTSDALNLPACGDAEWGSAGW